MKKIFFMVLVFTLLIFWFMESRNFYCIDENKCITVWKTYSDTCYIMPYKYYGLVKPSNNYVVTANGGYCDIIWSDKEPDEIIFSCSKLYRINNDKPYLPQIIYYKSNQQYYDSIFTFFDGTYKLYKEEVNFIGVDILENYAWSKTGKIL